MLFRCIATKYNYTCTFTDMHIRAETSFTVNDDFNEQTNTLLYKNINLSPFILKGWFFFCLRGELERETDCYIDPSSSTTIWALLSHLGLGCSTVVLTSTYSLWLEPPRHLVILFSKAHLLPQFFRLFTQVLLLIDGSVEGNYIKVLQSWIWH